MKNLFDNFDDKNLLKSYLPEYSTLNKIDKIFFLNILNTLRPNMIDRLIFDCIKKR